MWLFYLPQFQDFAAKKQKNVEIKERKKKARVPDKDGYSKIVDKKGEASNDAISSSLQLKDVEKDKSYGGSFSVLQSDVQAGENKEASISYAKATSNVVISDDEDEGESAYDATSNVVISDDEDEGESAYDATSNVVISDDEDEGESAYDATSNVVISDDEDEDDDDDDYDSQVLKSKKNYGLFQEALRKALESSKDASLPTPDIISQLMTSIQEDINAKDKGKGKAKDKGKGKAKAKGKSLRM